MRVAFCFSGLPRGIKFSKDFWLAQIERYNADVFGSFWDSDLSEIETFNSLFKPKRIEIENYDVLKLTTFDYINNEIEPLVWLTITQKLGVKMVVYSRCGIKYGNVIY